MFKKSLDWRTADLSPTGHVGVVGIKNQVACGSCFAFSAVSAVESPLCISGEFDCKTWPGLSEQQVLDCGSYFSQADVDWLDENNGHLDQWFLVSDVAECMYYRCEIPPAETRPWVSFHGCAGGVQSNVLNYVSEIGGLTDEVTR